MRIKNIIITVASLSTMALCIYGCVSTLGAGALKRHVTLSGIYATCKPEGYDVVCFSDADGKDGGTNCIPLSLAGGKCH